MASLLLIQTITTLINATIHNTVSRESHELSRTGSSTSDPCISSTLYQ